MRHSAEWHRESTYRQTPLNWCEPLRRNFREGQLSVVGALWPGLNKFSVEDRPLLRFGGWMSRCCCVIVSGLEAGPGPSSESESASGISHGYFTNSLLALPRPNTLETILGILNDNRGLMIVGI
jgi:hypothetical protein